MGASAAMARGNSIWKSTLLATFAATLVSAHDHDHGMDNIEEGKHISAEAIDSILWIHILLMSLAFGIIFPTGMVLGIVRNRWHVPTQILGTCIAVPAYFLGHLHGGRQFTENIHAKFANILMLMLAVQVVFGIYLKFHITKGFHGKIRKVAVVGHGIVGKAMPVVAWVQMLFGGITALGFCHDDHLGQCLAHFIMGSTFIGTGIVLTIAMLVGQMWLKRTGRSQEFYESALIAAWGCVNTFTEHRWGGEWVGNDIQHTTMGVVWWALGLVGIWLSRKGNGQPKRNFIPGFVIFVTGWAMSAHPQHLPLSTMVHTAFGYTLMAAGAARIIEVSFVLKDKPTISEEGDAHSFQYIAPFLLICSGFLFMAATEEQMDMLTGAHVSHVSYVLVLYSFASIIFLFVNILLALYLRLAPPSEATKDVNGTAVNGHTRGTASRQIRDAEEFELEGLMSDDEGEGLDSPSTVGKNNEARVS